MTNDATDWTVLITVTQSDHEPPISDSQSAQILDALGATDAWIQYPPASGRGHGFETRWWQSGTDSCLVALEAMARYRAAVDAVGIEAEIVLVHVASPEERLSEAVMGVERRAESQVGADTWNVMLRAVGDTGSGGFPRTSLEHLLRLLPGAETSGFSREGMVEVRFWVDAHDAVDANERGAVIFARALSSLGRQDWTIVRAHVVSIAEAGRTTYAGVERRMRTRDSSSLRVSLGT